ncbi:MAG: FapA family protein [Pseudomonadales bacterium]|nr:FapA family protein [Pseudomonadales bacterium]
MQLIISFEESDATVYAEVLAGESSEAINPGLIKLKLEEAGYKGLAVDPQAVNKLCIAASKEEPLKLPLKVLKDATLDVSVIADKTQVLISMVPADGGKDLSENDVKEALQESKVDESMVDWPAVNAALQKQKVKELCIAKAVKAVPGIDAVYIPLVESELDRAPKIDEQGVADMLSAHKFTLVDIGDPLMRREPSTEGTVGKDVCGGDIKPVPGNDPGFAKNIQGAEISSEDANLLVASIKGHPILLKNGVTVDSVLHVDEVSLQTGNIKFDGSLEVKGDVSAGMHIEVTGDVIVKGAVERATIKSGSNVIVRGGIFGAWHDAEVEEDASNKLEQAEQQEDGESLEAELSNEEESEQEHCSAYEIIAKGSIEAGFINQASIHADENIVIKQYSGNSLLWAGHRIALGQNGGKGILYGGYAKALHEAAIAQLGNDAYLETRLTVGELDQLLPQLSKLKKVEKARQNEATQLGGILEKLEGNNALKLGKISVDKTKRIKNTIAAIQDTIKQIQQRMIEIESELQPQKNASVLVSKKIYPNAIVNINGTVRVFNNEGRGDTWRVKGKQLLGDNEAAKESSCK